MIKAIQTKYDGYNFRIRLEARWAVFFNKAKIEYEYEKEGFKLSKWYLPDFWLPKFNLWIEVKGDTPTREEVMLCRELSNHTKSHCTITQGLPSNITVNSDRSLPSKFPFTWLYEKTERNDEESNSTPIGTLEWFRCPYCLSFNLTDGDFHYMNGSLLCISQTFFKVCDCHKNFKCSIFVWRHDTEKIKILNSAKEARFEFGESPVL